jgi:hypothetical protein
MNVEQEFINKVRDEINNLLNKAKERNEFEYAKLLLRASGGTIGITEDKPIQIITNLSHISESIRLVNILRGYIKTEKHKDTRLRLRLLIYCHIVEMSDIYSTIGNLFRICHGGKYDSSILEKKDDGKLIYPTEKISELTKLKEEFEIKTEIINIINLFYDNDLRNSLSHSSYYVHDNLFTDTSGNEFKINKKDTLDIQKDIIPKLTYAENYFDTYLKVLGQHKMSYKENKRFEIKDKSYLEKGIIKFEAILMANGKKGLYHIVVSMAKEVK